MSTKHPSTGGSSGGTGGYNNTTALFGFTTAYDRAGNKLYERHLHAENRGHLYQPFNPDGSFGVGYDSASRLQQYQRGVLSPAAIPFRVNPGASIQTPITLPGTAQVRTYGLDGLGNWKNTNATLVDTGGITTSMSQVHAHNYVNEITSVRTTTGGTTDTTGFAYDRNGNLLNDGTLIYQYDALNRLLQISRASDSVVLATYVYDALNRRIQKTINDLGGGYGGITGDIPAGTINYLYDGQQIVEERDNTGTLTKANFWGQYTDEMLFFIKPTETVPAVYRVISDLLYRTVAIVTTDNVTVEAYDTDAYGNTLCYSGPGPDGQWFTDDDVRTNNPINTTIFTGRQFDPESQIYFYRARYYAPTMGRFISRDPLGSPLMMEDANADSSPQWNTVNVGLIRAIAEMVGASGDDNWDQLFREPLNSAEIRQGPNLYCYVQDNPVKNLDPTGLIAVPLGTCTPAGWDRCMDSCKPRIAVSCTRWRVVDILPLPPFIFTYIYDLCICCTK